MPDTANRHKVSVHAPGRHVAVYVESYDHFTLAYCSCGWSDNGAAFRSDAEAFWAKHAEREGETGAMHVDIPLPVEFFSEPWRRGERIPEWR